MSDMRVSRDAIQQLVGQASQRIAQVAGTAAGERAGKLLGEVTRSFFEGASAPRVVDRIPAAMERMSTGLRALGIDATTIGEVLNALNQLLGKNHQMRRDRTVKAALKKTPGLLSAEDEAKLQDAIDDQAAAAELLSSLADAQGLANKGRYGKY